MRQHGAPTARKHLTAAPYRGLLLAAYGVDSRHNHPHLSDNHYPHREGTSVKALRLLAALAVLVSCVSRSAPGDEYIIKPGDTLSITVLGEADLTKRFQVDAESNITMPLVKQVHVADMTAQQAPAETA